MNRIMAALALAAASAFLAAPPAAGAERRFSVTEFDRIVVEGPYQVRLATGRSPGAAATGSAQALDRVSIDVQGTTLRIRPNRSSWGGYPGAAAGPVTIELSTRTLRAASVNGAGSLSLGPLRGLLRLDLAVEGSGRIAAPEVQADTLTIGLLGSGRIEVAGRAAQLRASVHGWAELDASALTAQGANISTDTAGRVSATVVREARVNATGIGEVDIAGAAACTVSGLSAGQVRCGTGARR
ncbi:MAG TPA: DUF2807 domain-containing protein [Allosphingosinicella sp.]